LIAKIIATETQLRGEARRRARHFEAFRPRLAPRLHFDANSEEQKGKREPIAQSDGQ
jgi:hypothetical protein